MRWFGCFLAAKKHKDQNTSDNDQNAANQDQSRRHEEFLSQKFCRITGCVAVPAFEYGDEVVDGLASPSGLCR